ncbi:MAG TPA: hypothetical protein VF712_07995 [Thermoleophilaceae bacterium]
MRTPSNRTGIPALPVILLVALILFLGLALAPRAFEFRAWPEVARNEPIEELVDRPAEQAVEVPVARVDTRGRGDALAVRGRNPRGPAPARETRSGSLDAGAPRGASRRGRRSRGARPVTPSEPALVVEETPAPAPDVPLPVPEQEAQLVEVPSGEQVLRPEPEQIAPESVPEPLATDAAPALVDSVATPDDDAGRRPRRRGRGCDD